MLRLIRWTRGLNIAPPLSTYLFTNAVDHLALISQKCHATLKGHSDSSPYRHLHWLHFVWILTKDIYSCLHQSCICHWSCIWWFAHNLHPVAKPGGGVKGVKFSPLSDPGPIFDLNYKYYNLSLSKFNENRQFTCFEGPKSGPQESIASVGQS